MLWFHPLYVVRKLLPKLRGMTDKDARALGETEQKLYVLDAWEEAPVYSERERAAHTLTDAVTRITGGHVPDSVFERAQAHFNEQELIALGLP